jgi:serine/threonine protein kinase
MGEHQTRDLAPQTNHEEYIGQGLFGKVYKSVKTGQTFAIKKLYNTSPDAENEKERLRQVDHPCIIKYHYSYTEGPLYCICMEYADAGTLTTVLQHYAKLPDTETFNEWNVWRDLAHLSEALHYLHSLAQPILHRLET